MTLTAYSQMQRALEAYSASLARASERTRALMHMRPPSFRHVIRRIPDVLGHVDPVLREEAHTLARTLERVLELDHTEGIPVGTLRHFLDRPRHLECLFRWAARCEGHQDPSWYSAWRAHNPRFRAAIAGALLRVVDEIDLQLQPCAGGGKPQ